MKRLLILLFTLVSCLNVFTQDIHFSQFYRCPLMLNPANTGVFDGDIRMMAIFRNQWQTIVVPYNSTGLSGDMSFPFKLGRDKLGVGLQLIADRAGDSKYTTLQASVSGAYHKYFRGKNPAMLSIGIASNYYQRSYDPNQLTLDNQFNGDYFDPTIPPDEQFDRTKLSFVDFGIGLNASQRYNEKHLVNIGASIQHIPSVEQNFFAKSNNTLLQPKWNVYINSELSINKIFSLIPMFFYQYQDKKYETVTGLGTGINLSPRSTEKLALKMGVNYRIEDAIISWVQFEHKSLSFHLSYDMNNSPLRIASNSYGGIEFSAGYIVSYRPKKPRAYDFCPYIWF